MNMVSFGAWLELHATDMAPQCWPRVKQMAQPESPGTPLVVGRPEQCSSFLGLTLV